MMQPGDLYCMETQYNSVCCLLYSAVLILSQLRLSVLHNLWALTAHTNYHQLHSSHYLPLEALMIHLVEPPLATGGHPPLGCSPLLVPELPLGALVAEDLNLGVAAVAGWGAHISPGVFIRVNLDMQRQTLHSFLCTA